MLTSRKPARRTSLPTAAQFEAMPLEKRTRVFAAWLKQQPRRKVYQYMDTRNCPLGRFGRAIFGRNASGAVYQVHVSQPKGQCDKVYDIFKANRRKDALCHSKTFGQASDAFHAALKRR